MSERKTPDVGSVWYFWFSTDAFYVDKRLRRLNRRLPSAPRCKFCNAPFRGVGGALERPLFGQPPTALKPRLCKHGGRASPRLPRGAAVAVSIRLSHLRGPTAPSQEVDPPAL